MNQFCCCISFLKQIMMKKKTKNRLQPKVKHRLNISSYFRRERSIFGAKMYRRKQHHLHMCWRLQRIEQQTVSQQSSCSRKPQDKQSSHFVRMWQLAGYRRCQKDVSQQNWMFLLLLPKRIQNRSTLNIFVFHAEKHVRRYGVPPSSVQFIKVICFIRSAFFGIFCISSMGNFLFRPS